MMTQKDEIERYIREHGSITPMDAFNDLGITKLATRVSEMKRDGIRIIGELEKGKNRNGKKVQFMRYRMEG